MPTISIGQALTYAGDAGFRGKGKIIIVAIAMAESGLNTTAYNPHDPYGGSFGILQINGSHFLSGTTTKGCALDPACSFRFAYELSRHGTYFGDWGTYTNGSYRQYLAHVRAASPGSVPSTTTSATDTSTKDGCRKQAAVGVSVMALSLAVGLAAVMMFLPKGGKAHDCQRPNNVKSLPYCARGRTCTRRVNYHGAKVL